MSLHYGKIKLSYSLDIIISLARCPCIAQKMSSQENMCTEEKLLRREKGPRRIECQGDQHVKDKKDERRDAGKMTMSRLGKDIEPPQLAKVPTRTYNPLSLPCLN